MQQEIDSNSDSMDGGGKIAMEGSSSNGQRGHNGRLDGKAITMGNGMVAV